LVIRDDQVRQQQFCIRAQLQRPIVRGRDLRVMFDATQKRRRAN
jgi:hypothetical protein